MERLLNFPAAARQWIWAPAENSWPFWRHAAVSALRIGWVIARDLSQGTANLRAMSLVYTSLLSIVPALAITFAILKAFGVHSRVEALLIEFLAPLGERGEEFTRTTIEFVENVNISLLGSVGVVFLIYTIVSMLQKIEEAFNAVWHARPSRSLARRVTDMVSFGLLGPLLIFLVFGAVASAFSAPFIERLSDYPPVQSALEIGNRTVPFVLVVALFTVLYLVLPNAKVRLSSAFAGALVAGAMWSLVGWAFATFIATSARYAALYSAFASLVLFMFWLYLAWLILLTGCSVSYYFQNRRHLSPEAGVLRLSLEQMKRASLHALLLIHGSFQQGKVTWSLDALAKRLHIPFAVMEDVLVILVERGFLSAQAGRARKFLPARPTEATRVADVLSAVREGSETGVDPSLVLAKDSVVDALFGELDTAREKVLDGMTIADLLARQKPQPVPALASKGGSAAS